MNVIPVGKRLNATKPPIPASIKDPTPSQSQIRAIAEQIEFSIASAS